MAGRDGNGNYTNPYPDFVAGTTISSSQSDANNAAMAAALSASIAADGQTPLTGNIPFAGYKITGLGVGSAATDSLTLGQAQANAYTYQGTDSGAADAYVIALVPAIAAQGAGLTVKFVAANASTGASTLNAGGGADAIEYQGAALTGAEIAAGATITCAHDGTAWQMTSPSALLSATAGDVVGPGSATADSLAKFDGTTGKLLKDGAVIGTDVEAFDADILKADTTDTLTVGYNATENDAGTKTTGTFTPDPADGNFQKAVNGGAHTLAPPASTCSIVIQYTNDASAGAITTSGYTLVDGDTISTTDADDFFFFITVDNGFSYLHVKALQ